MYVYFVAIYFFLCKYAYFQLHLITTTKMWHYFHYFKQKYFLRIKIFCLNFNFCVPSFLLHLNHCEIQSKYCSIFSTVTILHPKCRKKFTLLKKYVCTKLVWLIQHQRRISQRALRLTREWSLFFFHFRFRCAMPSLCVLRAIICHLLCCAVAVVCCRRVLLGCVATATATATVTATANSTLCTLSQL